MADAAKIRRYDKLTMTVRNRRLPGVTLRPAAVELDGRTFTFLAGWRIEDEHRLYPGEWAMIPRDPNYPIDGPTWIASGDLVELKPNKESES